MARKDHVRYQLFLPQSLSKRFETLANVPGVSKSAILVEAIGDFLDRRGDDALEFHFAERLDQVSKRLARIERNNRVALESLSLFIRYMLTVNAPIAEGDETARVLGRQRFAEFVERVGRQVASGYITLLPEEGR